MKKIYIKPCADLIAFRSNESIMDDENGNIGLPDIGGDGVTESIPVGEDW